MNVIIIENLRCTPEYIYRTKVLVVHIQKTRRGREGTNVRRANGYEICYLCTGVVARSLLGVCTYRIAFVVAIEASPSAHNNTV
jgi:hypothetical protein